MTPPKARPRLRLDRKPAAILSCPVMSILGCVATDAEALVAAVASSAGVDWRASAWLLEHHPQHREQFGDLAHDQRIRRQLIAQAVAAIAAAALPPDDERRVLLQMQAHGL
jgi:hypothetical protein